MTSDDPLTTTGDSPSERENELWSRVKFATLEMHSILDYMQNYRGAQENIGMVGTSTRYLVPGTWYQVLGTRYLVPGT